ncbi:MAG: hypothetical protein JNJ45_02065 [Chthonomonas sp.]|nr:hypothetical protein [Chthonomonas sp.]
MRVSTNQQYNTYSSRIHKAQADYFRAQQEVMTGKRADLFTTDPAGAAFVVRSKDLHSALTQYRTNLRSAKDYSGATETALGNLHDIIKQAKVIGLQGANSSTDQAARDSLAKQITELQTRFLQEVNTTGGAGQYIFAGQDTGNKPFALNTTLNGLDYSGDANPILVEVGPGETIQVNQNLSAQFQQAYTHLENLRQNLATGNVTGISDINLAELDRSMEIVRQQRGEAGAKMTLVTDMENHGQRRIDELTQRISDVEEVDLSEAITRMQLAETAYQASLQVTSQAQRLSLMDYLR